MGTASSRSSSSGHSSDTSSSIVITTPTRRFLRGEQPREKLIRLLDKRQCKVEDLVQIVRLIGLSTSDEKLLFLEGGIFWRICALIQKHSNLDGNYSNHSEALQNSNSSKKTPASTNSTNFRCKKGIGYGHGSTKSQWDIERTVEARYAREEQLTWLLHAFTVFIWGDNSDNISQLIDACAKTDSNGQIKLPESASEIHLKSRILMDDLNKIRNVLIELLEHLNNDSVFDISQHIEFYEALMELTAALAILPGFRTHLLNPNSKENKSVVNELIPRFRDTLNTYPASNYGHASPDIVLINFLRKVEDLAYIIMVLTGPNNLIASNNLLAPTTTLENSTLSLPTNNFIVDNNFSIINQRRFTLPGSVLDSKPNSTNNSTINSNHKRIGLISASASLKIPRIIEVKEPNLNSIYANALREFHIQTHKILNDAYKPIFGFSFKKELRSVNPYSAPNKERTKRIAKELASMHALPLNASNSIFICIDESRCDMLKVLISGPDDTPYANGLFEFDVFFSSNYPQTAPKCAFLTTGNGVVRFNPNLYNDGKICLSILGTWEGRPEEKWNPFCSLLQVLISIQGLIFVKQPYFNEPGYEQFQGTLNGEALSKSYNLQIENATLIYAIMEQLKNPPPYFSEVIKRHFWLKRNAVLRQAERWLQDVAREIRDNSAGDNYTSVGIIDAFIEDDGAHIIHRQHVRKLIEQFKDMKNPFPNELANV